VEILAFSLTFAKSLNILYAAIGLGLVIVIHELGHFAVAKWCGVKVERFSIGFGPILWKITRGETDYALSAIPFGGYVKMLGQDDADPGQMTDERLAKDPRSYMAKTVPQRIAIISAGVINNMLSAVLFFIIAFMLGVQYHPAIVGSVTPGMPAWQAGLQPGDVLTRIGNRDDPKLSFTDLRLEVAFSGPNEEVEVAGEREGKPFTTKVKPILSDQPVPTIFVEPSQSLTLPDPKDPEDIARLTTPGLSASRAEPPLKPGDEIRELDGVTVPDYPTLQRVLAEKRDRTVEFGVRRKGEAQDAPLTRISVEPNHFRTLGLHMEIGQVTAIQRGSPAEGKFKVGDKITNILAPEQRTVGADLDPLRLPDYFAALAGREVQVRVKREAAAGAPSFEEISLVPEDRPGWIERPVLMVKDCPLSVPALGIAFHVSHHVAAVDPGSPADKAGIKKDDNLQSIEFVSTDNEAKNKKQESQTVKFDKDLRNWPAVFWAMQAPDDEIKLTVKSQGADDSRTVTVTPEIDADWYLPMRGFMTKTRTETRQAANIGEAVTLGLRRTRDSIVEMWLTIKGLFSRRISTDALGGPIRIAETAYFFSSQGIPDLILFLGILSVSLAVLNFLPIPVLDGGHFVFLCWEGIRGKPPSERVVVTATYVGLCFVLGLMGWFIVKDIRSFFPR
jgi:regulator of sigma E protease